MGLQCGFKRQNLIGAFWTLRPETPGEPLIPTGRVDSYALETSVSAPHEPHGCPKPADAAFARPLENGEGGSHSLPGKWELDYKPGKPFDSD